MTHKVHNQNLIKRVCFARSRKNLFAIRISTTENLKGKQKNKKCEVNQSMLKQQL